MKRNPSSELTGENYVPSSFSFALPRHLLGRLYLLGVMVALEYLYVYTGRGSFPGHLKMFGMDSDLYGQIPIFAYVVFLGLGYSRFKARQEVIPFGRMLFAGHLLSIAAVFFITLTQWKGFDWRQFDPYSHIKCTLYLLATILLAFACIPPRSWIGAVRATGLLWLYALVAGVGGWLLGSPVKYLWGITSTAESGFMQRFTLDAVGTVLGIFLPNLVVDPATFTIGTPQYLIEIAPGCSGIEGLGLVVVFTSLWLWYSRKECRFPQALLLIPCALICSWLLNIVRLCVLILIMDSKGSIEASNGFHASAGWIGFIVISMAFSVATLKIPWMRRSPSPIAGNSAELRQSGIGTHTIESTDLGEERGESAAIRAYLLPFLAILAASFVSKAASENFEWLYGLRFVVAAAALCYFWPELKKLNWRFGWVGPATGVVVFLIWMAPTWWTHQTAPSPLGPALDSLSPFARWIWIVFRVAAAVITVPIAEELAFRGYLSRRLMSRDFDSVSFTGLTALSIGLSSVVFGLMHGQHWFVGIVAGIAYAGALRWRGRMGDAVVAHAVSNLLLAAWVLGFGDWGLW